MTPVTTTVHRPKSVVSWTDPFLIAGIIIASYLCLAPFDLGGALMANLIVFAIMLVMIPIEYVRCGTWRQSRPHIRLAAVLKRTATKVIGLAFGLGLVIAAWYLFPAYDGKAYKPLFELVRVGWPYLPCMIIPWVFLTEWRMGPVKDHAWHFGLLVLCRFDRIDWSVMRQGLLGWLCRGFFFPINYVSAVQLLDGLNAYHGVWPQGWMASVACLKIVIYGMLVLAMIPGYMFGTRLLRTENKMMEASWFGWAVTMLCYPPVNIGTGDGWFQYRTDFIVDMWVPVFGTQGAPSVIAGSMLLAAYALHYWGESIFCLRSSHLSNRGIITNGPFTFTKHPAYLGKCCAWTLIAMPFVATNSWLLNLRHTILMLLFFGVYFMRSWVEERLLSCDPTYVAYAHWVDRHGALRFLARLHPIFSYGWRYKHWVKSGVVPSNLSCESESPSR